MLHQLSLIDVVKHYFNYSQEHFTQQGEGIFLTKCPLHGEKKGTSLALYSKPTGWDWYCFGSCKRGGTAPQLLVEGGLFQSIDEAEADLRNVFKLTYPDTVTLQGMEDFKGLTVSFLTGRGITEDATGISIPYYNLVGDILAVKRRVKWTGGGKYFFAQGSNEIYGLDLLGKYDPEEPLYIAEGETDCLTMLQAGLPCIGIPGTNAWKPAWAHLLSKFKTLVVIPDQDDNHAGDNLVSSLANSFDDRLYLISLPPKFNDVNQFFVAGCRRDASELYKYCTTRTLTPATPNMFINVLKRDKTRLTDKDSWAMVKATLPSNTERLLFKELLITDAGLPKGLVNAAFKDNCATKRADSQDGTGEGVYIADSCYYRNTGVRVSNFVLRVVYALERDNVVYRVVRFVMDGVESRSVTFTGEELTRCDLFVSKCKNYGNYLFTGTGQDLAAVNALLFMQESHIVKAPAYMGRTEDGWFFGVFGITLDGTVVEPDEQKLIHLSNDSSYIMDERFLNTCPPPTLPTKASITPEYRRNLSTALLNNLGGYEAWMALGFAVSGWYSNEIFQHKNDKSFPIFFIEGMKNSGKTYLARWLMNMYGLDTGEQNLAVPTVVSMYNRLAFHSSLPVWYDDYKNDIPNLAAKMKVIQQTYNRQGRSIASRNQPGTFISTPTRGLMLLSGEDAPNDSAILSRCCMIQVSANSRHDEYFPQVMSLLPRFAELGLHFCLESQNPDNVASLLTNLDLITADLVQMGVDTRTARCNAVFAASFLQGYGDILTGKEKEDFLKWLRWRAVDEKTANDNQHMLAQFFDNLTHLIHLGKLINGTHYHLDSSPVDPEEHTIILWGAEIFAIWEDFYREEVPSRTIMHYLRRERYCEGVDVRRKLPSMDMRKRCIVLNLTKAKEYREEFAEAVIETVLREAGAEF